MLQNPGARELLLNPVFDESNSVGISILAMKLILLLATVFLDTEAAFTSKHYANQKVYSNNTKQNLPNVKSQIACCNRCLSTQDCLGIKHEESTCTLVSNAFPIIESNPTNAEDIFMDQDVVKSYEKYPYSLDSSSV